MNNSLLKTKEWQDHSEIVRFCEKIIDKSEQFDQEMVEEAITLYNRFKNTDNKIALKSGMYFELFDKADVPFLNDLEKKDYSILLNGSVYELYDATKWNDAQKIDKLYEETYGSIMGFDIDDYRYDISNEILISV